MTLSESLRRAYDGTMITPFSIDQTDSENYRTQPSDRKARPIADRVLPISHMPPQYADCLPPAYIPNLDVSESNPVPATPLDDDDVKDPSKL